MEQSLTYSKLTFVLKHKLNFDPGKVDKGWKKAPNASDLYVIAYITAGFSFKTANLTFLVRVLR